MKNYEATERAFKNGYEKGYEEGKPKWIPVGERLPEKGIDVLCCLTIVDGSVHSYAEVLTYIGDNKWEDTYSNWNYGDLLGITHWMPLPEPPKEGD